MQKQYCCAHKQAIIGFADDIPICSSCETDQYWVLQSSQQKSLELYEESEQKFQISKSKIIILKAKRKLQNLTQSFQVIESHFINQLNDLIQMHLKQSFNIQVTEEMIKNIDLIQSILDKHQKLVINPNESKIVNIFVPKRSKLRQLEIKLNQQQTNLLENKPQAQSVQVQIQEHEREDVKQQQGQLIDYKGQGQLNLGMDDYQKEEVVERLKNLRYQNIYLSENDFYKRIYVQQVQQALLNEIMSKKLCIELAPEELQKMNRETNYCDATCDYSMFIRGYTQNYLLNGRGMVYNKWYYENGYYIDGLLIWGQIICVQNNTIKHQEIVNDDSIELIKQIAGYSLLWNRYHFERTQNSQNF